VGLTEAKAAEKYPDFVKVGRFPFRASGRALASGDWDGLVKVVVHARTGEILGVHMAGAEVTELIPEVVMAREMELTVHELHTMMHAHPTLAEAVMEAAADALGEAIHI
jgi:dihydrolipoamide dehydrogenase